MVVVETGMGGGGASVYVCVCVCVGVGGRACMPGEGGGGKDDAGGVAE